MTTKRKRRKLRRVPSKKKKGPRRHIRKSLLIVLVFAITAVIVLLTVPGVMNDSKLQDLGYSSTTIKNIKKQDLTDTILKHKYYSKNLANAIDNGTLEKDYIVLYASVKEDRSLTAKDFLLYSRLEDKGYETDQLVSLFSNLEYYEITPLLVFDYQWDTAPYIKDCKANRDHNSEDAFYLDGSYITRYKLSSQIEKPDSTDVLVNSSNYLDASYVPSDLTEIDTQYAVNNIYLSKEAADAFTAMSKASVEAGKNFYASAGYRSYDDQNAAYQSIVNQVGESKADAYCIRAGYTEHQTGLAVNVAATYETKKDFKDTSVFQWLMDNCASYGFIERYPTDKEYITGNSDEPEHFRYVGKDIAEKVQASYLTYDEYYDLYLAEWHDKKCKPSDKIIRQAEVNPTAS